MSISFVLQRDKRKLRMSKRLYEFYVAPITTFWAFSLSYAIFLIVLSYMCLVRTPVHISAAELFVIVYIVNVGVEQIRKVGVLHKLCLSTCIFSTATHVRTKDAYTKAAHLLRELLERAHSIRCAHVSMRCTVVLFALIKTSLL